MTDSLLSNLCSLVDSAEWEKAQSAAASLIALWRRSIISFTSTELNTLFRHWTTIQKQVDNQTQNNHTALPPLSHFFKELHQVTSPPAPLGTPPEFLLGVPVINRTPPKIILNIMIKNEANLLSRCLKSILPIIDAVAVADTGSTDKSLQTIADTIPVEIPLSIEVEEWKNFGHNRTLGLHQAQRFVRHLNWDASQTYILLMDADMCLQILPEFKKSDLVLDQYNLEQIAGGNQYWNVRFLRASLMVTCVGATHEYYSCPSHTITANLHTLKIDDRNDGNNKSDKYSRDEKMLLGDLEDNPTCARAMFYLAQTYQNRNDASKQDAEKAIMYYEKHLKQGSWEEEQWYSMYCIGHCYTLLNKWPEALVAYLKAYLRRPHRLEPLYSIGKFYRDKDQHALAMIFFQKALQIPFPKDDILFIEGNLYKYDVAYHASICAYYVQQVNLGAYCMEKVLREPTTPSDLRQSTLSNARFYVRALPSLQQDLQLKSYYFPYNYLLCNPAVTWHDNRLYVVCRGVNYTQRGARNYHSTDADGIFRTINSFQILDRTTGEKHKTSQWKLCHEHLLKVSRPGPYVQTCSVRGLEDIRSFWWKDAFYFSCTSLEHHPSNMPRICLCELDEKGETVKTVSLLTGFEDDKTQKNWLPFVSTPFLKSESSQDTQHVHDEEEHLYFIYQYQPLTILQYVQNGKVKPYLSGNYIPVDASQFRGSAGPVKLPNDEGWLVCVHIVHDAPEERRYMHRFIWFDKHFQFRHLSPLFYFTYADGVEMSLSMTLMPNTKNSQEIRVDDLILVVATGIEDSQGHVLFYALGDVLTFTSKPLSCTLL